MEVLAPIKPDCGAKFTSKHGMNLHVQTIHEEKSPLLVNSAIKTSQEAIIGKFTSKQFIKEKDHFRVKYATLPLHQKLT